MPKAKIIPFPGRGPGAPVPPRPPVRRPPATAGERRLVDVYRCSQAEALVVKSLFESHGIPAVIRARLTTSVYPFSVGHQGEVALLVPEADAARSRHLLVRIAPRRSLP
jgi:hypothetical protein